MDEAKFKRLVSYAKAHLKSPADIYTTLDPHRQQGPYLRNWIAESKARRRAWDAMSQLAREHLRNRQPLPDKLADWVADVLEGKCQRPPKSDDDDAHKRVEIYLLIYHFIRLYDLTPTRGLNGLSRCSAEGGTACDVVGAAAGLNYKNAEKYWNERDPLFRSYKLENK